MKKLYLSLICLLACMTGLAQSDVSIITSTPEGTVYNLYRSSTGYESFYYNAIDNHSDGDWSRLVISDDGSVYLENPINSFYTKSWLKGQKAVGDTIVFNLPQAIYSETYDDVTSYGFAYRMKKTADGKNYAVDKDNQILKYVLRNDSLIKVDEDMLGVCTADSSWISYGELTSVNRIIADNTVKPADGVNIQSGLMLYLDGETSKQKPVKYAISGDDIWLGGLTDNLPDKWIHGSFDSDSAFFDPISLLGIDTITRTYVYASNANVVKESDPYYGDTWEPSFLNEPVKFAYNAADGTLFDRGSLVINKGMNEMTGTTTYDIYQHPQISPWQEVPGTPLPPIFTNYMEYSYNPFTGTNDGGIEFKLSYYSTDGNYLDPAKLYYNIYFDGQLKTFTPEEYTDITTTMTDIPYSFNSYNIEKVDENVRRVYFFSDVKRFGAEAIYIDGDQRYTSGITTYTVPGTDGISGLQQENSSKPVEVTYTDIAGRRVSRPAHGLYIQTTKYADGTVKSVKVNK